MSATSTIFKVNLLNTNCCDSSNTLKRTNALNTYFTCFKTLSRNYVVRCFLFFSTILLTQGDIANWTSWSKSHFVTFVRSQVRVPVWAWMCIWFFLNLKYSLITRIIVGGMSITVVSINSKKINMKNCWVHLSFLPRMLPLKLQRATLIVIYLFKATIFEVKKVQSKN